MSSKTFIKNYTNKIHPFSKIIIEETEREEDFEDYFNGESNDEEEEESDVIYLEDVDDSEADTEDEDDTDDEDKILLAISVFVSNLTK